MIRRRHGAVAVVLVISALAASQAFAHCQIPCGIYGDELRVQLIAEHAATIEKSMNQIVELGKASPVNYNQLVRWVSNKEEHARKIQDIVTAYFMAQRIKAPADSQGEAYDAYLRNLELLHRIQVAAMKAKQTTDLEHVETLRALLKKFHKSYFGDEH
ncbi:MAG: superoxide dismutase [bacterium]|nr:superoxide dismutase [bacterium]